MEIIPFKEQAAWTAQITLSGVIFNLSFYWNALNQYWSMNIYDINNNPVVLGVKVVVNWNLTGQFVQFGMPSGDIICQNILGLTQVTLPNGDTQFVLPQASFNPIGRLDMGNIAELFYYQLGEISTLKV